MATKHTPGPWQQHDADYCQLEIWGAIDGPWETGGINGVQVCDVLTSNADACLIAAAPDLLSALVDTLERLERLDARAMSFPITISKARAAIVKAEGR